METGYSASVRARAGRSGYNVTQSRPGSFLNDLQNSIEATSRETGLDSFAQQFLYHPEVHTPPLSESRYTAVCLHSTVPDTSRLAETFLFLL